MKRNKYKLKGLILPFLILLSGCSFSPKKDVVPDKITIEETLNPIETVEFLTKARDKAKEINSVKFEESEYEHDPDMHYKDESEYKKTYTIYENAYEYKGLSEYEINDNNVVLKDKGNSEILIFEENGIIYRKHYYDNGSGEDVDRHYSQSELEEDEEFYDIVFDDILKKYFPSDNIYDSKTLALASDGYYYLIEASEKLNYETYMKESTYKKSRYISKYNKNYELLNYVREYEYRSMYSEDPITNKSKITLRDKERETITFTYGEKSIYENTKQIADTFPSFYLNSGSQTARTKRYALTSDLNGKPVVIKTPSLSGPHASFENASIEEDGTMKLTVQFTNVTLASKSAMNMIISMGADSYGEEDGEFVSYYDFYEDFIDLSDVYENVTNLPNNVRLFKDGEDMVYFINESEDRDVNLAIEINLEISPIYEDSWQMVGLFYHATKLKVLELTL